MAVEPRQQSIQDLLGEHPEAGYFVSQMMLFAHNSVEGLNPSDPDKTMEAPVASAVIDCFFMRGVVGQDIARLQNYVDGDPKRAFEVLNNPDQLEVFKTSLNL